MVLVVMGVAGSGKTTVGEMLARRLGWPFEEGDDLHPQSNVDKMRAGHPLSDADRGPWLERVTAWVEARLDAGGNGVIACSALKRAYRDLIDRRGAGVVFIFLKGSREAIAERLAARHGHYMPAALLDSQISDLEPPAADEPALTFDAVASPSDIVNEIVAAVGLRDTP